MCFWQLQYTLNICTQLCSASICRVYIIVPREFVWFIIPHFSELPHWHLSKTMITAMPGNYSKRYGSPPGRFPSLDLLLEYWIDHVNIRLFYVKFVFSNTIFCRGVGNRLSLRCLVPWINHLHPLCWPTLWKLVSNNSWFVSLIYNGKHIFSWFFILLTNNW